MAIKDNFPQQEDPSLCEINERTVIYLGEWSLRPKFATVYESKFKILCLVLSRAWEFVLSMRHKDKKKTILN